MPTSARRRTGARRSASCTRRLHSILWVTLLGGLIAVLGFIFCIIPGIYLWVSFTVAVPVSHRAHQGAQGALPVARRS